MMRKIAKYSLITIGTVIAAAVVALVGIATLGITTDEKYHILPPRK